jgi:hypothetical protein
VDVEGWRMGPEIRGKKVHLVPISTSSAEARRKKRAEIARHYNVRGPFLFLHVNLLDNRSEFSAPAEVSLKREGNDYVGEVFGAIAIANSIAFVSEAIDPISIFIGLTGRDLLATAPYHSPRRRLQCVVRPPLPFTDKAGGALSRIRRSNCDLRRDEDWEPDWPPSLRSLPAVRCTSHAPGGR